MKPQHENVGQNKLWMKQPSAEVKVSGVGEDLAGWTETHNETELTDVFLQLPASPTAL